MASPQRFARSPARPWRPSFRPRWTPARSPSRLAGSRLPGVAREGEGVRAGGRVANGRARDPGVQTGTARDGDRGADFAVIIGSEEREKGEAQIKDLKLGARLAAEITDNKTWREDQPAQFSVARGQILSAIKARLEA